ncbi:MAG TPA: hypothetical protein VI653_03925 [Steroidobacteraceae bacterium]
MAIRSPPTLAAPASVTLPNPNLPASPREIFREQLTVAESFAKVPHVKGAGWHAYRRKWATERGDLPLKTLMVAGGWRDLQTLVTCYQHPSEDELLKVMAHPTKLRDRRAVGAGEKLR